MKTITIAFEDYYIAKLDVKKTGPKDYDLWVYVHPDDVLLQYLYSTPSVPAATKSLRRDPQYWILKPRSYDESRRILKLDMECLTSPYVTEGHPLYEHSCNRNREWGSFEQDPFINMK